MTAEARDAYGNLDATFTGTVTLALAANPGPGTLGGTLTGAAVAGVATFATPFVDRVAAGYTLAVTSGALAPDTTTAFAITPAAASQLAFTAQPAASVTAGAPVALAVTALDAFGNVDTAFTGNVTLALNANPGGATLGGTLTAAAVGGVAAFSDPFLDKAAAGYDLGATSGALTTAVSSSFAVTPAAALTLQFTTQPPPATQAGAPFTTVVTAYDAFGNIATGFSGGVTIALGANPGGGALGGTLTVSASAGVATFTDPNINVAAAGYDLAANAAGLTGATSSPITISAAAAVSLVVITQPPASVTAGQGIAVQVEARDAFGNLDATYTGNVTLALAANPGPGTLGGTLTTAAVAGVATFATPFVDRAAAGYTLAATSGALAPDTTTAFAITPAAAAVLTFTAQPPVSVQAGAPIGLAVTALDAFGNVDVNFTGSVTLSLGTNPGGSTLGGTLMVAAVAGVAPFSDPFLDIVSAGYVFAADAGALPTATSSTFDVTAAAAQALVFTTQPAATVAAGAGVNVVVTARDVFGNTATAFGGSVTLAILNNPASGTLGGTVTLPAASGVVTFPAAFVDRAGTGYTLEATAAGLTAGSSNGFDIVAAPASQLVFTVQPPASVTALTPFGATVEARDAFGNLDLTFGGSVGMALGANPTGATLGGTVSVAASGGVAAFANLTLDNFGANYTLIASSAPLSDGTSGTLDVAPPAGNIAWINPAGGNWSTGSNWSGGAVPTATDTVLITQSGTYGVFANTGISVARLVVGGASGTQSLVMTGNIAHTVSGNSDFGPNSALDLSAGPTGSLTLGGVLTTTGQLTFSDKMLLGTGTLRAAAGSNVTLGGAMTIDGPTLEVGTTTATWSGGGVNMGNGGVLRVLPGAQLAMSGAISINGVVGVTLVDVQGAASFAGGGTLQSSAPLSGNGTIDVLGGSLVLTGGSTSSLTFTVAAGATLDLNGGTHQVLSGGTMTGAGDVVVSSGTLTVADPISVSGSFATGAGVATLNGAGSTIGTLGIGGGAFVGNGTTTAGALSWTAGSLGGTGTTTVSGAVAINNNTSLTHVQHTLVVAGTGTWTGNYVFSHGNGAVLRVAPGGTLDVSATLSNNPLGGAPLVLDVQGALTGGAAGGTDLLFAANVSGTVTATTGTIRLGNGGASTGAYAAAGGSTLEFSGGTHSLNAGSSLTGAGTVAVSGGTVNANDGVAITGTLLVTGGGVANLNGPIATVATVDLQGGGYGGTATIGAGALNWSGGSIGGTGTTTVTGAAAISGTTPRTISQHTLALAGTGTWTGTHVFSHGNGAVLRVAPGGTLDFAAALSLNPIGGVGAFLDVQGALTGGGAALPLPVTTAPGGSVTATAGTFALTGGTFTTSAGTYAAAAGDTLELGGTHVLGNSVLTGAGTILVGGGVTSHDGTASVTGEVRVTGGALNITDVTGSIATLNTTGGNTAVAGASAPALPMVRLSAGNFTASTTAPLVMDTLDVTGGVLDGPVQLRVNGLMHWGGGQLTGALADTISVQPGGQLLIDTVGGQAPHLLNSRVLSFRSNTGGGWTQGHVTSASGGVLHVATGAILGMGDSVAFNPGGSPGTFDNDGDLLITGTTNPTTIATAFHNDGVVTVGGVLATTGGGTSGGSFLVGTGGRMEVSGGHTFTAASSVTGPGEVEFVSGGQTVGGFYNLSGGTGLTRVTGGSVAFTGPTADSTDALAMFGGTVTGSTDLVVRNAMDWSAGGFAGTGTTRVQATALINSVATKAIDGRTVELGGSTSFTQGAIALSNGAILRNLLSGTFQMDAGTSIDSTAGTGNRFENIGALVVPAGAGSAVITAQFVTSSPVDLQSGTLELAGGGTLDGALQGGAGTTLRITGGLMTLAPTLAPAAGSHIELAGGTTTLASGTVTFDSLTISGGTLDGSGGVASNRLVWSGGTVTGAGTLDANQRLWLANGTTRVLDGRTLRNLSQGRFQGGTLEFRNGGRFENLGPADFYVQADGAFTDGPGAPGVFDDQGFFQMEATANLFSVNADFQQNNTVQVDAGTLRLEGPGSLNSVLLLNATTSTLEIAGATAADTVVAGGGFDPQYFSGTALIRVAAGALRFAPNIPVRTIDSLELAGGALDNLDTLTITKFSWSGGELNGAGGLTTIPAGGRGWFQGATFLSLQGGTLETQGLVTWTNGAGMLAGNGAILRTAPSGTIEFQSDFGIQYTGGAVPRVENFGTILRSAGITAPVALDIPVHSTGNIAVGNAQLAFTAGGFLAGGGSLNPGTALRLEGDFLLTDTLVFSGTGQVIVEGTDGRLALAGHRAQLPAIQTLGAGVIEMTNPADTLATGQATFAGGAQFPLLTEGVLAVAGNLDVQVANFASGNHRTVFAGAGAQQVSFTSPATSRFGSVIIDKPGGGAPGDSIITALTNFRTNDSLVLRGSSHLQAPGVMVEAGGLFHLESNTASATIFTLNVGTYAVDNDAVGVTRLTTDSLVVRGAVNLLFGPDIVYNALRVNAGASVSVPNGLTNLTAAIVEGSLDITNGELAVSGLLDVRTGGVFAMNDVSAEFTGNVATIAGTAAVNGGTFVLTGAATVDGQLTFAGALSQANGTLGSLLTQGSGVLEMTNPNAFVTVQGAATFSGGSQFGLLTTGQLSVGGDFSHSGTGFASGSHLTVLDGSGPQSVSFASPATSRFGTLIVDKPGFGGPTDSLITFLTDVRTNDSLVVRGHSHILAPSARVEAGGLFHLESDQALAFMLVLDVGTLQVDNPAVGAFRLVPDTLVVRGSVSLPPTGDVQYGFLRAAPGGTMQVAGDTLTALGAIVEGSLTIFGAGSLSMPGGPLTVPAGGAVTMDHFGTVLVAGPADIAGTMTINGGVFQAGAVTLDGDLVMTMDGPGAVASVASLVTQGAGKVTQSDAGSSLNVATVATFGGGTSTHSAGILSVSGDFTQAGGATFQASNNHITRITGGPGQLITFADAVNNGFGILQQDGGGGAWTAQVVTPARARLVDVFNTGALGGAGRLIVTDSLHVEFGSAVNVSELELQNRYDTTFTGHGVIQPGTAYFTGSNQTLPQDEPTGWLYNDVVINPVDFVTVPMGLTVNGAVRVLSGQLRFGSSNSWTLNDTLLVTGTGQLVVHDPSNEAQLLVAGPFIMESSVSGAGLLDQADLYLFGDFEQRGAVDNFAPTPNFETRFGGSTNQHVRFETPGAAASRFASVVIENVTGEVLLRSDATITGNLFMAFAPTMLRDSASLANTLTVGGSIIDPTGGQVLVDTIVLTANGPVTLPASLPTVDVASAGTLTLTGPINFSNSLTVSAGTLALGGFPVDAGSVLITGTGALNISFGADSLTVVNGFTTNSASNASVLASAYLVVGGNFTQVATVPDNFAAANDFKVVMGGSGAQTMSMGSPGPGASNLGELRIRNTTQPVTVLDEIYAGFIDLAAGTGLNGAAGRVRLSGFLSTGAGSLLDVRYLGLEAGMFLGAGTVISPDTTEWLGFGRAVTFGAETDYATVIINGTGNWTGIASDTITGDLVIQQGGFRPNNNTLRIGGNLRTENGGRLESQFGPGELVDVVGDAVFAGGVSSLFDDELRVGGSVRQTTGHTLAANSGHQTTFTGTGPHTIDFLAGTISTLGNVQVPAGHAVTITGDVNVAGVFFLNGGSAVSGAGRLRLGGLATQAGDDITTSRVILEGAVSLAASQLTLRPDTIELAGASPPTLAALDFVGGTATAQGVVISGTASSGAVTGVLPPLFVRGAVASLDIAAGANFSVRRFQTEAGGVFSMTAAGTAVVADTALFAGGGTSGLLQDGEFLVLGDFQQFGGSGNAFDASGNHLLVLDGSVRPVSVHFTVPGASRVARLTVLGPNPVTMQTEIVVTGQTLLAGGSPGGQLGGVWRLTTNNLRIESGASLDTRSVDLTGLPTPLDLAGGSLVSDTLLVSGNDNVYLPAGTYDNHVRAVNSASLEFAQSLGLLTTINGSLVVDGNATLTVSADTLLVTGELRTETNGRVSMDDANGRLIVGGDATFAGGSSSGFLTAGELRLRGSFVQGGGATDAFQAAGAHATVFEGDPGVVTQNVTMANPGAGGSDSRFHVLRLERIVVVPVPASIHLLSNVYAGILADSSAADTVAGGGFTLTAEGLNVADMVFDNAPLAVVDNQAVALFDDITFQNMATTVTQFRFTRASGTYTVNNITFQTTPVNPGLYLEADGPLQLTLNNPVPAAPGVFFSELNGANVTWGISGASNTWINLSGGNWGTPANWSKGVVPDNADSVLIDQDGTYTITVDVVPAFLHIALGASTGTQTLLNASQTMTVGAAGMTVAPNGVLTLIGTGAITGTGTITSSGAFNWTGGTLSGGGTLQSLGPTTISGSGTKSLSNYTLEMGGVADWTGTGAIVADLGATFRVASTGVLTIGPSTSMSPNIGGGVFDNLGDVNVVATAGTSVLDASLQGGGQWDVQSGVLDLPGGGTFDGIVTVTSGAELQLNLNAFTFGSSSSVSGAGTFTVGAGTVDVLGAFATSGPVQLPTSGGLLQFSASTSAAASGAVTASAGLLALNARRLNVSGNVTVSGSGLLSMLSPADTLTAVDFLVSSSDSSALAQGVLMVSGSFTQTGPGTNYAAYPLHRTEFNGTAAQAVSFAAPGVAAAQIGTLRNRNTAATVTASTRVVVSSAVIADAGTTFAFAGGGRLSGGATIGTGAILDLTGDTLFLTNGYSATGNGVLRAFNGVLHPDSGGTYTLEHLTVTNGLPSGGQLSHKGLVQITGSMIWNGGTITSSPTTVNGGTTRILSGATLAISGPGKSFTGNHIIHNQGTVTWTGTGNINGGQGVGFGATFQNDNLFLWQGDAQFLHNQGGLRPRFVNTGTLRRNVSTGTAVVQAFMNQTGTIDVVTGTLRLSGGRLTNFAGSFTGTATLDLADSLWTPTANVTTAGNLTISGTGRLNLGSRVVTVGGNLTTTGSGTIAMTSASDTLRVLGDATFGGGSEAGLLTNGALRLGGSFSEGGGATDAFQATTGHLTVFEADPNTVTQSVFMADAGASASDSRFGLLRVGGDAGPASIHLTGQVYATFVADSTGTDSIFGVGAGAILEADGLSLDDMVFSNAQLQLNPTFGLSAGVLVFMNMDPDVVQLFLRRPTGAFAIDNIDFRTVPNAAGDYFQVEQTVAGVTTMSFTNAKLNGVTATPGVGTYLRFGVGTPTVNWNGGALP